MGNTKKYLYLIFLFLILFISLATSFSFFNYNPIKGDSYSSPIQLISSINENSPVISLSTEDNEAKVIKLNNKGGSSGDKSGGGSGVDNSKSISASHITFVCGNGIAEGDEECDDRNDNDHDECTNSCEKRNKYDCEKGIGSPDKECKCSGFDFGIVKYECEGGIEKGPEASNYDISLSWNKCNSADWTADPGVDGILSKEATIIYTHDGGASGTIDKTTKHDISHITFCGYENTEPEPYCGDNIINNNEQCDNGESNDIQCIPDYDESCTYCSDTCEEITISGGYCGDNILQEPEEQCDGILSVGEYQECSDTCELINIPYCGDGHLDLGEECDDDNNINGDGCDENCIIEICEHDVGIRYSYGNSFGTGIAIKLKNTDDWLDDPVELTQGQDYIIKYIIDNKIENSTNNIHVMVKINGIVLAEYNHPINKEDPEDIDLNTSGLTGTYNISVYVEKINEIDCNLTDNYAQREIIVSFVECGDGTLDSNEQCDDGNNANGDGCDKFCEIELCYGVIIPPAEQCKSFYCDSSDGQIKEEYTNFPSGTSCNADSKDCTMDQCDGSGNCVLLEDNCNNNECCSDEQCPDDEYDEEYCLNNDVYHDFRDYFCLSSNCEFNINKIFVKDCGDDSCDDWNYYCEDGDVYKDRNCYDRGCESNACYETENNEKEKSEECGENEYGEWKYECRDKEIWKTRTNILRGCLDSSCTLNEVLEEEYIDLLMEPAHNQDAEMEL
jgi:cysteine-rich repeat protein